MTPADGPAPDSVRAPGPVHQPRIAMRPHLWLHWAKIAVRQERRAQEARARGQAAQNFGPYVALETEEAIEAIAATRHCLHNFFQVWTTDLGLPNQKSLTPAHFTTAAIDAASWRARVKGLIGDRDDDVRWQLLGSWQPHQSRLYATGNGSATSAWDNAELAPET